MIDITGKSPIHLLILEAGGPASASALHQLRVSGLPVRLIAADMDPNCAASALADEFYSVSPAADANYIAEVMTIIADCDIHLVLPSFHFAMKEFVKSDHPAFVNDFTAGLLCQDKWRFYKWCCKYGYTVPRTTLLADGDTIATSKLYLKPRYGVGAKENFIVNHEELKEITSYLQRRDEYIVQEFIDGEQWVVDALRCDGKFIGCTSARVATFRAGHAIATEVIDNLELTQLARAVLDGLDYEGPANFDVIRVANGDYCILELNPRFGGTIHFAYAVGTNWPAYLLSRQERFLNNSGGGRYSLVSKVVRLKDL